MAGATEFRITSMKLEDGNLLDYYWMSKMLYFQKRFENSSKYEKATIRNVWFVVTCYAENEKLKTRTEIEIERNGPV